MLLREKELLIATKETQRICDLGELTFNTLTAQNLAEEHWEQRNWNGVILACQILENSEPLIATKWVGETPITVALIHETGIPIAEKIARVKKRWKEKAKFLHEDCYLDPDIKIYAKKAFQGITNARDVLIHAIENPTLYPKIAIAEAESLTKREKDPHFFLRLWNWLNPLKVFKRVSNKSPMNELDVKKQLQEEVAENKQARQAQEKEEAQYEKLRQEARAEHERDQFITRHVRLILPIRRHVVHLLELHEVNYEDNALETILSHFQNMFPNLNPAQLQTLQSTLSFVFDDKPSKIKDFATKLHRLNKLPSTIEFRKAEAELNEVILAIQFADICNVVFQYLFENLMGYFDKKQPISWKQSRYPIPSKTFIEFVGELSGHAALCL